MSLKRRVFIDGDGRRREVTHFDYDMDRVFVSRFRGYARIRFEKQERLLRSSVAKCGEGFSWISILDDMFVVVAFGGAGAMKVIDASVCDYISGRVLAMWAHGRRGFPGSLAVSLMEADLPTLGQNDYV